MLKIYGTANSRAFRVIWLAEELGIRYEHVPVTVGGPNAQCKEPWYLELNPNGRVPTIDDDGVVVWESAAINLYMAEKYASPLFPSTWQGKAAMLQWSFFVANDVEPLIVTLLRNRMMQPPEKRNAAATEEAEQMLSTKLDILEGQLQRTRFFGGDAWNMADFMVASPLYVVHAFLKLDMSRWPKLAAWLEASVERPAARAARKLREG